MDIEQELLTTINEIYNIPQLCKDEILEYIIQHGEYGIALEDLCSVIEQERISLSRAIYDKIIALGVEMELDPSLWNRLLELVR